MANVLDANSPQLTFSFLYLAYNTMLSCFLVQSDFSKMCAHRKPLRVSEPQGDPTIKLFYLATVGYDIPLYVVSGIMHWLISQSLAQITALVPDGTIDEDNSFSTCGCSPIAAITGRRFLLPSGLSADAYRNSNYHWCCYHPQPNTPRLASL